MYEPHDYYSVIIDTIFSEDYDKSWAEKILRVLASEQELYEEDASANNRFCTLEELCSKSGNWDYERVERILEKLKEYEQVTARRFYSTDLQNLVSDEEIPKNVIVNEQIEKGLARWILNIMIKEEIHDPVDICSRAINLNYILEGDGQDRPSIYYRKALETLKAMERYGWVSSKKFYAFRTDEDLPTRKTKADEAIKNRAIVGTYKIYDIKTNALLE